MTPFRFRLQRLLELRERHERDTAVRLAEARAAAAARRAVHEELAAAHDAGRDRLRSSGAPAGELQALGVMLGELERHVQSAASAARSADEAVAGVEADLQAATQARRVLDRLRERRAEEWRAVVAAEDLARMDAIALTRFHNRAMTAQNDS